MAFTLRHTTKTAIIEHKELPSEKWTFDTLADLIANKGELSRHSKTERWELKIHQFRVGDFILSYRESDGGTIKSLSICKQFAIAEIHPATILSASCGMFSSSQYNREIDCRLWDSEEYEVFESHLDAYLLHRKLDSTLSTRESKPKKLKI